MPKIRRRVGNTNTINQLMKSKFLLFVLVLMSAATVRAQLLVATLTHNDTTTAYYGGYAFQQALAAADHGDVINLSEGAFQSTTITKAVTIQGAGMRGKITFMAGETSFDIPNTTSHSVKLEGLYFQNDYEISIYNNFDNAIINKCSFPKIYFSTDAHTHLSIVNSILTRTHSSIECDGNTIGSITLINCFCASRPFLSETLSAHYINCVVSKEGSGDGSFENCIFFGNSTTYVFTDFMSASSSLIIGSPIGDHAMNCIGNLTYEQVFATFRGTFSDAEDFALTENAATTYLGSDGTQVGLYGGYIPFDPTPFYPQITKMNVAKKTTADGKLSVDIEVSTATDSNEE